MNTDLMILSDAKTIAKRSPKLSITLLVALSFCALLFLAFQATAQGSPKPTESLQAAILVMEEGTTQMKAEVDRRSVLIAQLIAQNDLDQLEMQSRRDLTSKLSECKYALLQSRPCDHQSLLSQVKPLPSPASTSTSSPEPSPATKPLDAKKATE